MRSIKFPKLFHCQNDLRHKIAKVSSTNRNRNYLCHKSTKCRLSERLYSNGMDFMKIPWHPEGQGQENILLAQWFGQRGVQELLCSPCSGTKSFPIFTTSDWKISR